MSIFTFTTTEGVTLSTADMTFPEALSAAQFYANRQGVGVRITTESGMGMGSANPAPSPRVQYESDLAWEAVNRQNAIVEYLEHQLKQQRAELEQQRAELERLQDAAQVARAAFNGWS